MKKKILNKHIETYKWIHHTFARQKKHVKVLIIDNILYVEMHKLYQCDKLLDNE